MTISLPAQDGAAEASAGGGEAAEAASNEEMLEMLGYITVYQSGMRELGFGADEAEAIARGLKKGLSEESGPDPALQAKMPQFQSFIQERAQAAEEARQAEAAKSAEGNIAEGEAFFAMLDEKEDVQTTESGLYYKVLEPGGDEHPEMSDTVLVHYEGTLIDGTKFDSSLDRGEPAEFPLNGVVQGFGEGLTKIGEGGKIILYIPSELGYGNSPRPGGPIEPGDTLIFECELIEINPGQGGEEG